MVALSPLELEVLNALSDDAENLEQIYKSCHRAGVPLSQVAEEVCHLVEKGLIEPLADEGAVADVHEPQQIWKAWFMLTPEGRRLWSAVDPALAAMPGERADTRYGRWKDLAVDVPLEVFQGYRHDMAGLRDEDSAA